MGSILTNSRSLSIRPVTALGLTLGLALALFTLSSTTSSTVFKFRVQVLHEFATGIIPERYRASCSPEAWADGQWKYRPRTNLSVKTVTKAKDALAFAGFEGCASSREYDWHLGYESERQGRKLPKVDSYQWSPSERCDVRPLHGASLVKELVEEGGWLLIGGAMVPLLCNDVKFIPYPSDSITENHFFSISCILYPHVVATPDYTSQGYKHDDAQHLYLSPHSPLISHLKFPEGFDIEKTPLVTYRRVDLLFEHFELLQLHNELYGSPSNFTLFDKNTASFNLSPAYYMRLFTKPLPEANYATLVASSAGHWTMTLFSGFYDDSKPRDGIDDLLEFFRHVAKRWASEVQAMLYEDQRKGSRRRAVPRRAIVRAYLPGHEDCHEKYEPWTEYQPFKTVQWNWPWIKDFNKIIQVTSLISSM
jgi:hypothetical protein